MGKLNPRNFQEKSMKPRERHQHAKHKDKQRDRNEVEAIRKFLKRQAKQLEALRRSHRR